MVLSDGTFGTGEENPVVLHMTGLAKVQGRFHYWRGGFWLENIVENNQVRLAGVAVPPNMMLPLTNDTILGLGETKMRMAILP